MSVGEPPLPAPQSPCVRNCCLDARDVCLGCGRHLEEILRWAEAGPGERIAILERAAQRRAGRAIDPFGTAYDP